MKILWYDSTPEGVITVHSSAEKAETAAAEEMDYQADCARTDCWHEDIEWLHWGELVPHARAVCVECTGPSPDHPDGTECWALVRTEDVTCEAHGPGVTVRHDRRSPCPLCSAAAQIGQLRAQLEAARAMALAEVARADARWAEAVEREVDDG